MKLENSNLFEDLNSRKLTLSFGDFYLTEKLIIAEIHEGEHLDWTKIQTLISELLNFYGENHKLVYITNRINDYSVDPQSWAKWDDDFNFIVASVIVIYNNVTYMNASIEKMFASRSLKRCNSLSEAIAWAENIREMKSS